MRSRRDRGASCRMGRSAFTSEAKQSPSASLRSRGASCPGGRARGAAPAACASQSANANMPLKRLDRVRCPSAGSACEQDLGVADWLRKCDPVASRLRAQLLVVVDLAVEDRR